MGRVSGMRPLSFRRACTSTSTLWTEGRGRGLRRSALFGTKNRVIEIGRGVDCI